VVGQAFLFDKLENGAGYCLYLAQPEVFSKLLEQEDLSQPNSLAFRWLKQHQADLRHVLQQLLARLLQPSYHGLLDWRLALDMARLLRDAKAPSVCRALGKGKSRKIPGGAWWSRYCHHCWKT
jgi:DEAD/DEAH box helicase domain-containing protein